MKVFVDMSICESHGQCTFSAPDVFRLDDDDVLQYEPEPSDGSRLDVERAQQVCPVQAIFLDADAERRRP